MFEAPGLDVLTWVDDQLAEARLTLAAQLDRTNALAEFRTTALTIANREQAVAITADALVEAAADEEERALLAALAARFTDQEDECL